MTRFEFTEAVTSDLSFVARADTLGGVFQAAADALLASTLEAPEALEERERRQLRLAEPDLELLLLRFLNELVYLRDAERLLLRAARVSVLGREGERRLEAELVGERIDASRHRLQSDIKAATAHGLAVRRAPSGWEATVTLDV